jgi:hypothetical protein
MTVARDRSAWGRKVEYKLELPPAHSRISADIERNTNDDKIGLDRRFNGKKSNYYYYYYYYYYYHSTTTIYGYVVYVRMHQPK